MRRIIIYLGILSTALACQTTKVQNVSTTETPEKTVEESTVIEVGSEQLTETELQSAFKEYFIADSTNFEELIDELVRRKRVYLAAKDEGYLLDHTQLEELETYTRIAAKSFIEDTALVNDLVRTTYNRLKREVNASHILLALSPYASSQDTIKVYEQITNLKSLAESGASFDSLAQVYSSDTNTKKNGGNMGYFSALQLLFPLENAAYSTPIGKISDPVRTKAGYHIIKVNDNRPYSGKVEVKHILKVVPSSASEEVEAFQKSQIDSLYQLLQDGAKFDELAKINSDDVNSKDNGGLLPPFSIGSWAERDFEKVAFSLRTGEISEPIRSSVGWHILQKNREISLEPFSELELKLRDKVTTDSRGKYIAEKGLEQYQKKLNININNEAFENIIKFANAGILNGSWKVNRNLIENDVILKVDERLYSVLDFVEYAEDKQSFEKIPENYSPELCLRWFFEDFKSERITSAVIERLPELNASFKFIADTYKESLLVTNYLNDKLYEKTTSDTSGQRDFYNKHIKDYQWPEGVKATIVKAKDQEAIAEYFEIASEAKPYRLKRGILPFYYQKNAYSLSDDLRRKLTGLEQILEQNPGYLVEIGGHRDINEATSISGSRIKDIVRFLTDNGIDITRIRENDYGVNRIADRFDWTQNQRVSFQFFSNSEEDIAKILQLKDPYFEVAKGIYFKGENELIDGTGYAKGEYESNFDDFYYRIIIEEAVPARAKSLREARGAVIRDYQKEKEEQLYKELSVRYPVTIDREKARQLYDIQKLNDLNQN
ncbi:peptidylprolyl isomerase [Jiulongibacter sp. NS-SX5]|uniref:peptidylprolyl isomerase n=1 Tax=Jiulongibacter sp. NS-SX5 TaxID=3463854 RepID=UPI004059C0B5